MSHELDRFKLGDFSPVAAKIAAPVLMAPLESLTGHQPQSNASMGDSAMTFKISIAAGVNVCKYFLDVYHYATGVRARFNKSPQGVAELLD